MKQKRKVKSLIPQKENFNGGFLTALLFVLGVALCLGAASLMSTSSVGAAKLGRDISTLSYSGVDDVVEVLYNLDFAKPEDLEKKVAKMYINNNKDFYLQTSIPLVVNAEDTIGDSVKENQVNGGKNSNILGGYGNRVLGSNVTIIGGNENVMENVGGGSFDNSVILGGEDNILRGGRGFPAIIVGGKNHKVEAGHDGIVIIGGESQKINGRGAENVVLIGGSTINVNGENAKNIIVGGKNINIGEGINNVFVFSSDGSFVPQSSGAFYLNVANGLGINTQALGKGITTNGPVKIGEVDINTVCSTSNLGVIGAWKVDSKISCLVGCSKTSAGEVGGPWEMLDRGKECEIACDNNPSRCSQKHVDIPEVASYTGFCVKPGGMSLDNSSPCTPDEWGNYENAFFEAGLIDSTVECPFRAANKCVYKCNTGYHLTGDRTNQFNAYTNKNQKCFKDCNLVEQLGSEWIDGNGKPIILKHNQMVTGYNTDIAVCARTNPYVNPSDAYGKDKGTKGDSFPEHCGNNQHKKPLVCVNGEMVLADNYTSPKVTSKKNAKSAGYWHRYCQTASFSCDTSAGNFDLSRSDVTTTLDDNVSSWQTTDRSTSNGTRGKYKLCLDYKTGANYTTAPGNEAAGCVIVQQSQPYEVHYKFEGCQAGYNRSNREGETDKYICRKECKVDWADKSYTVRDNRTITLYKDTSKECSKDNGYDVCAEKTFTCNDGVWDSVDTSYKYSSCKQNGRDCKGEGYNVEASVATSNMTYSKYEGACHSWKAYGTNRIWTYKTKGLDNGYPKDGYVNIQKPCSDGGEFYKLIGCANCHHTINNKYCESEENAVKISDCTSSEAGKVVAGWKYKQWTSATYNGGEMRNYGTCEFYCNDGYYRNGSSCKKNPTMTCDSAFTASTGFVVLADETKSEDHAYWYRHVGRYTTGSNSGDYKYSDWCFDGCHTFYHRVDDECELITKDYGCFGTVPAHASVRNDSHVGSYGPKEYRYSNSYEECGFYCDDGYTWNGYACVNKSWKCDICSNTISYDADGGIVNGLKSEDEVLCNEGVSLPGATKNCYKFEGWYQSNTRVGGEGSRITPTTNMSLVAHWSRDTSADGCAYKCGGDTPELDSSNMEWNGDADGDDKTWSYVNDTTKTLTACQWRCKTSLGYVHDGNECRQRKCATPIPNGQNIKLGDKETLLTSVSDGKAWSYTSSSNPGACQWTCQDGYTRAKDAAGNWLNYCEAKKCGGTPGTGPKVITGVGEYTGTVTKNWHSVTGTTAPGVCEWTCQGGWVPSGNTCILDENAQCKNSENPTANGQTTGCISGTVVNYDATTLENKKTWSCKSKTNSSETSGCRHCKSGYTGTNCDKIENGKCNNEVKNGCFTGTAVNSKEDNANHKYTWDCDGVNGGTKATGCFKCFDQYVYNTATKKCEPNSNGDCGNPQVPYNCASGTSGAALFQNHKYTWDCIGALSTAHCKACEEGYDEDADGNCKNKKIDGECDFETAGCLAGEYEERSSGGPYGKAWACKGVLNGSSEECVLQWDCAGECKLNVSDGSCGEMYFRRSEYGKDECAAAGEYVTYGQAGGITSRWPCWTYKVSSMDGWVEGWLYSTNIYCPDAISQAQYGGKWTSCFKYESKLKCNTFINGTKTSYEGSDAVSKCNAILAKKPTDCTDSNPGGGHVQTYTLTINANGGTYGGQTSYTYQAGVTLSVLTTQPTREGYKFKEWNSQSNGNGTTYNSTSTMPASNLTVYAVWEKIENKKYWLKTLANDYGGPCKGRPSPIDWTFMGLATPSRPYVTYTKDNMGNVIGSTTHWPEEFSTLTSDGKVGTENDRGTYAWAQKQINEAYYGNNGSSISFWRRYNPSNGTTENCIPGDANCVPCIVLEAI